MTPFEFPYQLNESRSSPPVCLQNKRTVLTQVNVYPEVTFIVIEIQARLGKRNKNTTFSTYVFSK